GQITRSSNAIRSDQPEERRSEMKIFILFILAAAVTHAEPARQTMTGYLKGNSKGEIFFVKNPRVLEPGVQVLFDSPSENRKTCKVTIVIPQIDCPMQTFSFIWGKKNGRPAMTAAQLESASSPWHRRQRTTQLFK